MENNWIDSEFKALELNDKRLNARARKALSSFGYAPGKTIPQAFQSRKEMKACYNFFKNEKVNDQKILAPHFLQTIERIKKEPIVLMPTDTSVLDYDSKNAMKGKGGVSRHREGIFLHCSIAITPERLNLGIVDGNLWIRGTDYASDPEINRNKLKIEEKESFRWLESYRKSCEIARLCPDTQIVFTGDRETDIVEILAEYQIQKKAGKAADLVIRSQHDRQIDELVSEGDLKDQFKKLKAKLNEMEPIEEVEFIIPGDGVRKARKVVQEIKASTLTFRTKKSNGNGTHKVTMNVVMANECSPPEGEKALNWILITTLPISTSEEIHTVFKYYLCRWEIEIFFKILKSGCKVEERQLHSTDRMKPLIALFMVLSWRIQFVMMLGRECPDISCADLFEDAEWKSVYKILNRSEKIPEEPPKLMEFIVMIARLGGYVKTTKSPPPGVKVMWKGMARMADFALAWEAFKDVHT